jgi:leucyl aminopeptidase
MSAATPAWPSIEQIFAAPTPAARPIHLVAGKAAALEHKALTPAQRAWLAGTGYAGASGRHAVVPGPDGAPAAALLGTGSGREGDPCGPSALLLGKLAGVLPAGTWQLGAPNPDAELAAIAWGLGAYRFRPYKSAANGDAPPALALPDGVVRARVAAIVEAIWFGRDLVNTPAGDMGPAELEAAARLVASRHGARLSSIVGEALLAENFPMIHAVGRASPRAPRLIDLAWSKPGGRADAPRITLVGKGICFDTGGLDIKPASGMLLMKKDMGGAASALALGHMIMALGLDVRLRILIAAAENAISGNAFRPGDVLRSRAGISVEIGNTDAEGRLVLADALALADAEAPDLLVCFATLTGAARVALGPDIAGLFTDDEPLAQSIVAAGERVGDPVWRLPFWAGYGGMIDSEVADINNAPESPFAGAITAALFLKRFVKSARRFVHLDMYGWRTAAKALGPKGGEPNAARALLEAIERRTW